MKVCVFGAGCVGLVTAVCLAELGHTVTCVDVDRFRIERIQAGESPIYEPGVEELIHKGYAAGRFWATMDARQALTGSEVSIIAVGTPDRDGRIDLHGVLEAAGTLGDFIRDAQTFHTIIVKSTVIPGTTLGSVREELEKRSGKQAGVDFGLGMNPEFLREGSAVHDFLNPDRVVIGALGARSADSMQGLYKDCLCPKLMVQPTEAEFIKYTANALLATLISFSNEVFNLCEAVGGVNGCTVLTGVLMDHRWTPRVDGRLVRPVIQSYVMGGVGYGGSCLPKDLSAITTMARDCGWKVPLLEAVAEVNRARPSMVVNRLKHEAGDLRDRKVAVLGMAFKPGTDDWRNSPSLPLIQDLLEEGSRVVVWDPLVEGESVAQWEGRVLLVRRADEALKNANIALVATAWPEIARWPWMDLIACMAQAVIYDGRNLLTDFRWPAGVRYIPAGAGRGDGEVR